MNNTVHEPIEYELVVDAERLSTLIAQWTHAEFLAIDTEFIRTNTFFAKPGLIQIADTQGVYLIDPIAINDLSPLKGVLENSGIVKIMHSMSEDVDLLFHSVGAHISSVFDTQIAASFLGIGPALGYQSLVSEVLEVELDKGETRSDWLRRPLRESQLHYAALDVIYLLKLYTKLKPRLQDAGYWDALFDESTFLIRQAVTNWKSPESAYLKLRGGWELSEASQRLLQALVMWRDGTAFKEDIPKPWVFNDAFLIEVARKPPVVPADLKRIKGMQIKSIKQFSERLMAEIESFSYDPDMPFQLIDGPVNVDELSVFRRLKSAVANVSKETGIPTQLLGSRKMLESLVIHCARHTHQEYTLEYLGWRKEVLEKALQSVLFDAS